MLLVVNDGIQLVAALRFLLLGVDESIVKAAAFTSLLQPELTPCDPVNAVMRLSNGNSGTLSISYGLEFANTFGIEVITDKGIATVTPSRAKWVPMRADKSEQGIIKDFGTDNSVQREIAVFAQSIKNQRLDTRSTPEEALMDLRVIQAILESGQEGGVVKSIN